MGQNTQLLFTILNLIAFTVFGYLLKRRQFLSQHTIEQINSLVFHYCFPVNVAMGFYHVNITEVLSLHFFIYVVVTFISTTLIALLFARLLFADDMSRAMVSVALYRGNFIIMGLPILNALFGATSLALAGIIIALSQLLYNFCTTYFYESACASVETNYLKLLRQVLTSPMLVGVYAGIFINLTHLPLFFMEEPLRTLGSMGTPLALIVLGYGFELSFHREYLKSTAMVCIFKLLFLPLLALFIAMFFPLSPLEKGVAVILFGAPTAVNSYTFAKHYGANETMAQDYVIYTTLFYIFTVYLILWLI